MVIAREQLRRPASYEEDGYSWALEQAALLRARQLDQIDIENIAEEIESLGKSFANELRSRYDTLVMRLLKWQFQPEQRSNSWAATIRRERREIERHLRLNPGLKSRRIELFADSCDGARDGAVAETDLPPRTFPEACPYSLEEVTNPDFWPGGDEMPDRAGGGRRRSGSRAAARR
jgi:Domain of unknown function DUF29